MARWWGRKSARSCQGPGGWSSARGSTVPLPAPGTMPAGPTGSARLSRDASTGKDAGVKDAFNPEGRNHDDTLPAK